MRKINFFLSLCLALIVGTVNAQTMPEIATSTADAKAYFIVNARCDKNAKFDGEGTKVKLVTDVANSTLWYFINAGEPAEGEGTPVKIYNAAAQKYVNEVSSGSFTDDVDAARTWYIKEQTAEYSGFAISKNANMSGYDSWNNEGGGGQQVDYWSSNDIGSIWTFSTLDEYYAGQKADYQAFATEATANVGTGLFYTNQEKLNELNTLLSAATPNTLEGISEAVANMAAAVDAVYNIPTTAGKYFLKGTARNSAGNYLTISNTGGLIANATLATRSVWELAPVTGGYTLQNVLTGKYVQYAGASTNFTLVDEPVVMQLFPNFGGGVWGTTAIGGAGFRQQMHEAGGNNIVGWEAADASNWTLVEYTDDMAESLATAENDLCGTPAAVAVAPVLGVSGPSSSSYTLNDILDGNGPEKEVYAKAAGKYYRITSASGSDGHKIDGQAAVIGIDRTNNRPCGVAASSGDIDAIWQFIPSENGVKIYSPNYKKYIGAVKQTDRPMTECAKMKVEGEGEVYSIVVVDETNKKFQFDGATCGNINMEGSDNSYVLSQWHQEGSHFTLAEVETVDVELLAAVAGEAYATAYLPFAVTIPSGVTAYVGDAYTAGQGYLSMSEAGEVKAENGFILKGEAAGNVTLTIGATEAAKESAISGTLTGVAQDDNNLVLGLANGTLGFYKWADAIPANKAFLVNAAGTGAVKLLFPGSTTGIDSVEAEDADNAAIYDLSGRKVLAPAKGGIYVKNGKKYIVK